MKASRSRLIAWLVFGAGAALRLEQLLARRSLWLDEALLATNIVHRSFVQLVKPLDGNQAAPVLFLWVERAAVLIGGNNEYALRMLPFVAGVALMPVTYALGRRLHSDTLGCIAMALVAFAPGLVRYSTEVKQYSLDALLAAVIVLLALRWVDDRSDRNLLALGSVGVVAVWASHPASFVLVGVGGVLLVDSAVRRDRWSTVRVAVAGVAWAASLGVTYLVTLRDLRANNVLSAYWESGYPPKGASPIGIAQWVPGILGRFAIDPGHLRASAVAGALAAIGIWLGIRHRGWARVGLLLAPAAVVLVASAARVYPFRGRLVLFLLPLMAVCLCGAFRRGRVLCVAIALLVVATWPWWRETTTIVAHPFEIAESRPVLEYVRDHRQPGDLIYIHGVTFAAYDYYGPIIGLEATAHTQWLPESSCASPPPPLATLASTVAPGRRVWIVFAYTLSLQPPNEAELVRRQLDPLGQRLDLYEAHDASAALYLIGDPLGLASGPPAPARPDLACLGVEPLRASG